MMGLLAISKWELRRRRFSFNRNTLVLSLLLVILIAGVSFFVSLQGIHINDNLYKVLVTDPDLAPVISSDNRFEVYIAKEHDAKALFESGGFDILITGNKVSHLDSEKSIAAIDALDKALIKYDEARLLLYNDLNNTFPVWITVKNLERVQAFRAPTIQKLPEFEKTPEATAKETVKPTETKISTPSIREVKEINNGITIKENTLSTPSHFNPPIPFKSVVLSFLFIFPIYFIAQLYSASIMEERIRRKGEMLLVSPVSSFEIVIGKFLPYLLITLVLMGGIAVYIGGSPEMLVILLPVALMFLSTAFLGAIISRSFKELTFVLVFLSVTISGYIFLPAMFANIHAISIISPMTLIVKLLEKETISMSEYLFSTLPFYLVSLLVFIFGIFIYREEDLFTQKSVKNKLLDSIQIFISKVPAPLFLLSIVLLPLVFSIQMILIVLMFNLPIRYGIIIFILVAAFIEEVVKSVGLYTVFSRNIERMTTGNAFRAGIYAGAGFFVGEKVLLLVVIAGISGSIFGSAMGMGLLVFPLVLHITSTATASLGIRYLGTRNYPISVILAAIVHSAYNLYLVREVLFG